MEAGSRSMFKSCLVAKHLQGIGMFSILESACHNIDFLELFGIDL